MDVSPPPPAAIPVHATHTRNWIILSRLCFNGFITWESGWVKERQAEGKRQRGGVETGGGGDSGEEGGKRVEGESRE